MSSEHECHEPTRKVIDFRETRRGDGGASSLKNSKTHSLYYLSLFETYISNFDVYISNNET